jgi:DNA repair exonuclease SbcCD ATPase subunit
MNGGMVVVGRVTGNHFIEDLQVNVPHMVPVSLTPEQVCRSRDLQRALQQQKVFKLDVTPFKPGPQVPDNARINALEQQNKDLRKKLRAAETQKEGLETRLEGLQQQLETVLTVLQRIEETGAVVIREGKVVNAASEAVGGEAPAYIPDKIVPENVETSITAEEGTSEGSSVTDAASRLRELKRQKGDGDDIDFG